MTLRSSNVKDNFTTDAEFRAQAQVIHDHFAAAGLVQTADTGQIDLATVAKPAAINTVAGYEVWRFDDALSGSAPIYFKFEYASGGVVSAPQFWITTGTGSDGAGAINVSTGTVTTRKSLMVGTAASGLTPTCYFDYMADESGFALLMWPAQTAAMGGCFVAIERFRDADGEPNADGWNVMYAANSTGSPAAATDARFHGTSATHPTAPVVSWQTPYGGLGNANLSALFGTILYPWPVFTGCTPRLGGPSQLVMGIGRADLAATAAFSVTHYGVTHDWIAAGPGVHASSGWGNIDSGAALKSFVMRAD